MFAYIYIYIINVIFNSFYKKRRFFVFFFVMSLVFLLGFRGESVGVDTSNYYYSFELIKSGAYNMKDPLYYIITSFLVSLGADATIFILLFSFLTIIPLSYVIYKVSPYPIVSFSIVLAFGFYAFYFNVMRQGASISFVVLSTYCFFESKRWHAICYFLIAVGLHATALVAIPLFFILSFNLLYFNFFIVLFWLLSLYSAFFGDIFYNLLKFSSSIIPSRFQIYIFPAESKPLGVSFLFDQLVFLFLFFTRIYVYKFNNKNHIGYVNIGLLGIVLFYFLSGVAYAERLSLYYYIFIALSLPLAISWFSKRTDRVILILTFVFLLFIQYVYRISLNPHDIVPYSSIFE